MTTNQNTLSSLPPSTRAVLASSTGSLASPSSSPGPSSPVSVSSAGGFSTGDRDRDAYPGRTPRPGTSLINMSSSAKTFTRGAHPSGEHLANHEHLTYAADDGDELVSPSLTASSSSGHRAYQSQPYGSQIRPSSGSQSQLRANRSAAAHATPDPYSPSTSGLHMLHSKGSNLSTSTFIANSSKDRESSREKDREESAPIPGEATPTLRNMTPFTPSVPSTVTPQPHSGPSDGMSTPRTAGPDTPLNLNSAVHTPQTATTELASLSHPGVVRAKNSMAPSANGSSQSARVSSRKSGSGRERDRDREGDSSRRPKIRTTPHLPHGSAEPAPPTLMYWSRAPVYGQLPTRSIRAHTVTLVDNLAWLFGGCDERGCSKDVWCCDVETFQWTRPTITGDIPPPLRAHTATLVDGKRIFIFGGGEGPILHILDIQTRRFTWVPFGQKPGTGAGTTVGQSQTTGSPSANQNNLPSSMNSTPSKSHTTLPGPNATPATPAPNGVGATQGSTTPHAVPPPRRAHTAVYYRQKLYIFGGGNGVKALNDVWSLDTTVTVEKMRWEQVKTSGQKPGPRGYHTANLVGNIMVVIGGSDGRDCFSDVWALNLDTLDWKKIETDTQYKRLSHSSTQVGSYLFIMGGHDGLKYSSELLLFNLVTLQYEHKVTMGRPPPARGYHSSILADARVLVFGGFDGHSVYDDVWLLELAGAAYLPQVTSFSLNIEDGR
ncbi:hypothetical protein FRC17_007397 [Serendipita sp. 399]|nr:hypothetical protein FRC17_007397 [Serendipita sp. 399]